MELLVLFWRSVFPREYANQFPIGHDKSLTNLPFGSTVERNLAEVARKQTQIDDTCLSLEPQLKNL
jgi:hypothetical protein